MKPAFNFSPGDVIEAAYPFVRDTFMEFDEEGGVEVPTWKPGVRHQNGVQRHGYEPEIDTVADAMGHIILTVVSIHKPGRYALRIFYTRRWRDPDGREFGKNACRVTTSGAFRALGRGYRHPFALLEAGLANPQRTGAGSE